MRRRFPSFVPLVLLVAGCACCGCGQEPARPAPKASASACVVLSDDALRAQIGDGVAVPIQGLQFGQEIWLTYLSPEHATVGYRYPRSREKARELITQLCERVDRGEDIGLLARAHSNAPGGRAHGFVMLPRSATSPDARDLALAAAAVGERTPILDWNGGFWFARRVDAQKGHQLKEAFEKAARTRAKARAIVFLHKDAFPLRDEFRDVTREQALAYGRGMLEKLGTGVPFADLARKYSNDAASKARGGLLHATTARKGESREWIHWGDRGYPQMLLDLVLERGAVGRVHPVPLDTERGVVVVEVLEREE